MGSLPQPVGLPFSGATLLSRQGRSPRRSHWHNGIDLSRVVGSHSELGTHGGPIAPGTVAEICLAGSARCSGYGNGILVDHGLLWSWYAHLGGIYVEVGDTVQPGDYMYDVGTSFGTPSDPTRQLAVPHLHLEIVTDWPLAANDAAHRRDVLGELAAMGVGLDGRQLVAGLEPFAYSEAQLGGDPTTVKSFSAAPRALERPSRWPLFVAFGSVALLGGTTLASLLTRSEADRERERIRRLKRG